MVKHMTQKTWHLLTRNSTPLLIMLQSGKVHLIRNFTNPLIPASMKLLPIVYMYHSNLFFAYVTVVQFQFDCVLTRYWLSSYFLVTKIFFGSMDTHSNNYLCWNTAHTTGSILIYLKLQFYSWKMLNSLKSLWLQASVPAALWTSCKCEEVIF